MQNCQTVLKRKTTLKKKPQAKSMVEGTACAPAVSSAIVFVLVPGEVVESVACMEETDPVVVTVVAVLQSSVGAVEAKAVSAVAAHTAQTLQASPTAGHNSS